MNRRGFFSRLAGLFAGAAVAKAMPAASEPTPRFEGRPSDTVTFDETPWIVGLTPYTLYQWRDANGVVQTECVCNTCGADEPFRLNEKHLAKPEGATRREASPAASRPF